MSIGSHLKTFKSTAQILPIINTMTLKASTVVNRTAMNEVLVGVNHPGECFVDKLVTVDDGQASNERKFFMSETHLWMTDPCKELLEYFKE